MKIYAGLMSILDVKFNFDNCIFTSYAWGDEVADTINDSKNSTKFLNSYVKDAVSLVESFFNDKYLKLANTFGKPFIRVIVKDVKFSLCVSDDSSELHLDYVNMYVESKSGDFLFDIDQKLMKGGKSSVSVDVPLNKKNLFKLIPESKGLVS